ncbi:MAG: hypothetical protein IJ560_03715 [Alphaproteobacteria bacterium]|nr:hypothetical protein [Alphaproteobacteria bacterium]
MYKTSYMGDGSTTEFYFNFPYFENNNIVVNINHKTVNTFSVIGTPGGLDADIPYTGGKVIFETAPTCLDSITIERKLPLRRIADYQPTETISPTTLNQDLNYLLEILKDRQRELDELNIRYSEITNQESTQTVLTRISTIHDEIVAMDAKITALGNPDEIHNHINSIDTNKLNKTLDNITTDAKTTSVSWNRQFTNVGTIIANGNQNIAGDFYMGFTDNQVKIGIFSCYIQTQKEGQTTMAISTDIMNGTVVATTNNGFTTSDLITIPFINKISISFPVTTAGVASASIGFVGWM